ncbi:tetratricopeptide repeat protein [Desulfonema magnum]|uniref:Uncharacterized protein n=1 Tax=Desulfonema magnum TaxID=45655 RepID=A0A975BQU6_9BACT|nr:hypothetical protein [Desulfonema magnum]QTA89870.1 Uncharacterized protein dnm_059270 [Desulfonema magnum]
MEDVKKKIKSFLQEAELYQSQGLLNEAKERYVRAGQLVKKNENLIKNKNLLKVISKKIHVLKEKIDRIESGPISVEMPKQIQDIIKHKFSFSKNDDAGALEGAIALAKFGQFEAALNEFDELIKTASISVEAAKNIIRCHKALDSLDEAANRYKEWLSENFFTPAQLNKLRVFLQGILDSQGVDIKLPKKDIITSPSLETLMDTEVSETEAVETVIPEKIVEQEINDEDIIDISSVGITFTEGPKKGETIEYDVSFQAGSIINLLISGDDKELVENLRTGVVLNEVQFYSPIAMFNGKAVVSSKSEIESGPKQGYYSLDIKVTSIL